MKKVYIFGAVAVVFLAGWGLGLRKSTPVVEPITVTKTVAPVVTVVPQNPVSRPAQTPSSQSLPTAEPASTPVAVQPATSKQVVDSDGVLMEEEVLAPDGKGHILKRYSYDETGRLRREIHIAENQLMENWDYTYDSSGKATLRITDAQGNVVVR